MEKKKSEVYILAGFLGSGKTTLLQKLLEAEKENGRQVAVLLNEIGEYSVDGAILGDETPLKELLKGCICCTLKDDLEIQIHSLYQEYAPDVIYIETTGVAHPMEVLDACMSPLVATHLEMKGIVSIVDAQRWSNRACYDEKLNQLLEEQVKYGDQIIINKVSDVSSEERTRVHKEVRELNPHGYLFFTDFSHVDVEKLQSNVEITKKEYEAFSKRDLRIGTMTYTFKNPIDQDKLMDWLHTIPETIYRIKGYVRFIDNPTDTYLFQYSYGVPQFTYERMKLSNNLVIIGSNLQKDVLKEQLNMLEA